MAQRTINFNRQTRLKWLQSLRLKGRGPLKSLLFTLESFLGDNASCWPSVGRLAEYLGKSERTVQRGLSELQSLELIFRAPRVTPEGRPTTFAYSLNWSLICDLASPDRGVTSDARGVTRCQLRGDTVSIEGCHGVTRTYHKNHPKKHHRGNEGTNGVLKSGTGRTDEQTDGRATGRASETKRPSLSATETVFGKPLRIEPESLDSADQVDDLFRLAVATGAILDNEAGRLKFFALARYCRRNPALKNPGAALASLVRDRKWFGSEDDEAAARRAIAKLTARRAAARDRGPTSADLRLREMFTMPAEALAGVFSED